MLQSMTGFGEADADHADHSVHVEARTVNNRYLKVGTRLTDGYGSLESRIESIVRKHVRRGTVQLNVHIQLQTSADQFQINESVLENYLAQLKATLSRARHSAATIDPASMLTLPGVIDEKGRKSDAEEVWPTVKSAVESALAALAKMRSDEGMAMARDLKENAEVIAEELEKIAARAPIVVESFQERLKERLNNLLQEYDVKIEAHDLVREVGVFAERADISEEVVRMRSHLEQFEASMNSSESAGRRLEFLVQEMLRETNTIGSKANDAEIAKHVVEIKTLIERMREMVQNIE